MWVTLSRPVLGVNAVSSAALFERLRLAEEFELDYSTLSGHQQKLVGQMDTIMKPHFKMVDSWKSFKQRSRRTKLHDDVESVSKDAVSILQVIQTEEDVVMVARIIAFGKTVHIVNLSLNKQLISQTNAAAKKLLDAGVSPDTVYMSPVCNSAGYDWTNVSVWLEDEYDEMLNPTSSLGTAQLAQAAAMIESRGSISLASIDAAVLPDSSRETREVLHAIIMLKFPVVLLSSTLMPRNGIVVDFVSLRDDNKLTVEQRLHEISKENLQVDGKYKKKRQPKEPSRLGPVPCEVKVPALLEYVRTIILQHAPVAHATRYHEVYKTGVSLVFLMQQVRENFAALKFIDKSTIARLLVPPRANTKSATMYKSLIPARVTRAVNNRRMGKEDMHFSRATVSIFQELAAYLGLACVMISCDEKASLVIGPAGVVSRYTRNKNVTPLDVLIDHYDHDFKVNGYLMSMTGILYVINSGDPSTTCDKYGRERVEKPRGGQLSLKLRSTKYGKPDIQTNAQDLYELLVEKKDANQLPPVVMLMTDGGDGYCSSRSASLLLYGRIYRDLHLAGLVLMRRAGGLSSENNIEHAWSPVSKQLGGLILSADPTGQGVPCQRPELGDDEILELESDLFDHCMQSVIAKLNENVPFTYSGLEAQCTYVPTMRSVEHGRERSQDYNRLHSSYKSIQEDDTLQRLFAELAHITRHVQLRKYALVFTTCDDPACDWVQCTAAMKTRAPVWQGVLQAFNGVLPGPVPSLSTRGHYLVFLQMLALGKDGERFPPPDFHAPSLNDKMDAPYVCTREDPACCKVWTHLSRTARNRHDTQFHMIERRAERNARQRKSQVLSYTMKCTVCDATFRYKHQLDTHQIEFEHMTTQRTYRFWKRLPGLSYTEKTKRAREKKVPDLNKLQLAEDNIAALDFGVNDAASRPALSVLSDLHVGADNIANVDAVIVALQPGGKVDDAPITERLTTPVIRKRALYSYAFDDFRPPPFDQLLPRSCVAGSWVFGYWVCTNEITRGCVMEVPRQKGTELTVRFLDDNNEPRDYKFARKDVFTTYAAASFALTHANDLDNDASEPDDEPSSDDNILLRINSRNRSDGVLPARGEPAYDQKDDPYNEIDDDKVLNRKRKRAMTWC